jgi:hypothetical protein
MATQVLESSLLLITNFLQCGFRKKYSTETAIFELTDAILQSLDQKLKTIGMFLDLSKAFDMVDPEILLHTLYMCGMRGTSLTWIRSFLLACKQIVNLYNN